MLQLFFIIKVYNILVYNRNISEIFLLYKLRDHITYRRAAKEKFMEEFIIKRRILCLIITIIFAAVKGEQYDMHAFDVA